MFEKAFFLISIFHGATYMKKWTLISVFASLAAADLEDFGSPTNKKTGHEKVDREKKGAKVMWTAHLIGYTAFLFNFLISCRNTICFSSTSYPQFQLSLE